ncbi:unnamed protein product [Adineta steineri]|uniref:Uncharacterized protein n=1 Tax=Adineta steineri TaxID=433720 RepID=A0A814B083_9BILA|nr:unnamed protein product [Adineta steineri]CAF4212308.1 unnamed protein product [Adineta steineri]
MTSLFAKSAIETEFDKIIKDLTGDNNVVEETEDNPISTVDIIAEQKRQAAADQERQVRHAKVEKEREDARQKIRDKYNLKKKDEPSASANSKTTKISNQNEVTQVHEASSAENQAFNPMQMASNTFNTLKKKFGWK